MIRRGLGGKHCLDEYRWGRGSLDVCYGKISACAPGRRQALTTESASGRPRLVNGLLSLALRQHTNNTLEQNLW
jgi:hypothetical protein